MEERKKLDVYQVRKKCECGGEMKWNEETLLVYPALYPHICDACGREVRFRVTYPKMEYVEAEE